MAVDSRDKRFSMLGFAQGFGFPYVLPNPDNSIGQEDRPQWIHLYHGSGIALDDGVAGASEDTFFFRRRRDR